MHLVDVELCPLASAYKEGWKKMSCLMKKTNKTTCPPTEDSDQPGHLFSLIRVFAVRMNIAWVLSYPLRVQRRLWSVWADAQADQSLCWALSHFAGFVMRRLKFKLFICTLVLNPLYYFVNSISAVSNESCQETLLNNFKLNSHGQDVMSVKRYNLSSCLFTGMEEVFGSGKIVSVMSRYEASWSKKDSSKWSQ